jgi:hypothetical protein
VNAASAATTTAPSAPDASTATASTAAPVKAPAARVPDNRPPAFELFCAYHLGITADGGYKTQNVHEIARRFNLSPAEVKQALIDHGIDSETVINADFDMAMAQLDIMVAPEGINRRELARGLYEEFLAAPKKSRDWERELRADAEANRRVFGK